MGGESSPLAFFNGLLGPQQSPGYTDQAVISNFDNNDVDYDAMDPDSGTVQVLRLMDGWTATD